MTDAIPMAWRAHWAWSQKRGGPGLAVRYMRKRFHVDDQPETLLVHVSADSRYRLWLNGRPIGRGPLKGTPRHAFYESYDLAPGLVPGLARCMISAGHF